MMAPVSQSQLMNGAIPAWVLLPTRVLFDSLGRVLLVWIDYFLFYLIDVWCQEAFLRGLVVSSSPLG